MRVALALGSSKITKLPATQEDAGAGAHARKQVHQAPPHLLPRSVLISPLCAMVRMGCARPHDGKVLVLKRLCTMAM